MSIQDLQHSGFTPSRLAMGCEQLGGIDWGTFDHNLARRAVESALDSGITVFDTADVYGLGKGEEELSKALGTYRHKAFIITKFGVRWQPIEKHKRAKTFRDSSPTYLRDALEGSLRRLRVDSIPLYLVHWPDSKTLLEDTLAALEKLRTCGKILNYGLSNFAATAVSVAARSFPLSAFVGHYNLVHRAKCESVFRATHYPRMARISYGPLAQGLLTGKYNIHSRFRRNDRRSMLPHFARERWANNARILNKLREIASRHKKTISQAAIRWVLDCSFIDIVIAGAKTPDQVRSNVGALNWILSSEEVKELDDISLNVDE